MTRWLSTLPVWANHAVLSAIAVAAAWGFGRLLRRIVFGRLARLTEKTRGGWDDVIVDEIARRVPFLALLAGCYVATGFWELGPKSSAAVEQVLLALVITSLTLAGASMASRLIVLRGDTSRAIPLTGLTRNIVRGVIVALGLLMILSGLGISITPILTTLGVGGLAVALALQDTLSNLFAGLYILMAGQIRLNDYIRLESGEEGYVTDIGWRATTVRMLSNNLILVPNSKLAQSIVTNYHLPVPELSVLVNVGVDYSSDLEHVERVTKEVAREVMGETQGGVSSFEPFIRYNAFADSSINFSVILRGTEFVDQYLLKHEFIKKLHARYNREGINIPFPIRTLVMRREEAT